ncbi:MAG: phosphatase PAP2 family protein [Alphaproteobacteria bacterium]|nr:phosphatase PAP2 family protein [Alphaproteobacteria bacterium]
MTLPSSWTDLIPSWWQITLMGEPALMIPMSAMIIFWLRSACGPKFGLWWGALLLIIVAVLSLQKILYYAFGLSVESIELYSVSGHSAISIYVYGSLAVMIGRYLNPVLRLLLWVFSAGLIIAIAISRLNIDAHRPSEILLGLVIGLVVLVVYLRYIWPQAKSWLPIWTLALPCLLIIFSVYGHVIEFERVMRFIGKWLRPGVTFI